MTDTIRIGIAFWACALTSGSIANSLIRELNTIIIRFASSSTSWGVYSIVANWCRGELAIPVHPTSRDFAGSSSYIVLSSRVGDAHKTLGRSRESDVGTIVI